MDRSLGTESGDGTARAVDRLAAEIDDMCARVTALIIERVPEFGADDLARTMLEAHVRQNADEVLRVFRGEPTAMTAARGVGLGLALAGVSLEGVRAAMEIGRTRFAERLLELAGEGEDLAATLARFDERYAEADRAATEEYLATKARLAAE